MPPHLHYVEPYAGSLAVLLERDANGSSEVVNDIHGELINFWNILASHSEFEQMHRVLEATPFSEEKWEQAAGLGDALSRAIMFFIRCRQSRAGCFKDFATLSRARTRRGMNEQASAWLTTIEKLPEVHARLKRVVILSRDALDVIKQQDGPQTLFYLDPPYLHETRATTGQYAREMSAERHCELLETIAAIKGKFILSGYRSLLYDDHAINWGWSRRDFDLPNNAAGGDEKRRMIECVWMNFDPAV